MSKVTVFCGGLDSRTRDDDVKHAFSRYGRVEGVKMQNGFCFIEMESMQDANAAISGLDGSQLDGRQIKVEMGRRSDDRGGPREFDRPKGPRETGMNRVRIENLASNVSWQDLKDFARQAGNPIVSQVDKFTGVGIIEYANPEDVRSALRTLDGRDFNGSRVRIFEDRGGGSARGGGGRGYGGGGGGGYGRDEPRGAGYARGGYDDVRSGGGGPPRGYDDRDRYAGGGGGYGRGYGGGGGDYGPRGGYDDRGSYGGGGGGHPGGGPRGYDDRPQGGGGGWGGERGRVDDRDRYGGGGGGGGGYDRGGYDRGGYDRGGPPPRDRSMPRGRY